jgi:rhodanese-related sulfurtransferase
MRIRTLFIAAIILLSPACKDAGPPPAKDQIAEALAQPDVLILDVRSPSEWAEGHVEGAVNLPLGDLDQVATIRPDKDGQIVVHCAVGGRSAKATKRLKEMGYTHILDAKTPEAVGKAMGKALVK